MTWLLYSCRLKSIDIYSNGRTNNKSMLFSRYLFSNPTWFHKSIYPEWGQSLFRTMVPGSANAQPCFFYLSASSSSVCESESSSVVSDSLWPHGLYSPWNSPGQNTGVGSLFPFPGDLPDPGIKPRSPALQADFLPAEPGKERLAATRKTRFYLWITRFPGEGNGDPLQYSCLENPMDRGAW